MAASLGSDGNKAGSLIGEIVVVDFCPYPAGRHVATHSQIGAI